MISYEIHMSEQVHSGTDTYIYIYINIDIHVIIDGIINLAWLHHQLMGALASQRAYGITSRYKRSTLTTSRYKRSTFGVSTTGACGTAPRSTLPSD